MPTKIEWAGESWNPIRARRLVAGVERIGWHCEHASEGCRNCYAETANYSGRSRFTGTRLLYKPGHRRDVEIFLDPRKLLEPLGWRRPRGVFPLSMSDLFGDWVEAEWIDRIFAVMGLCPHLTFRVLTKRSPRMRAYLNWPVIGERVYGHMCAIAARLGRPMPEKPEWPLRNVWLGVSVEDQKAADLRIPDLLATPAAIRWLSCEPLIGPLDLTRVQAPRYVPGDHELDWKFNCLRTGDYYEFEDSLGYWEGGDGPDRETRIDWAVVGGESGGKARDNGFEANARSILAQCQAEGVAFFGKQNVRKVPLPDDLLLRQFPELAA